MTYNTFIHTGILNTPFDSMPHRIVTFYAAATYLQKILMSHSYIVTIDRFACDPLVAAQAGII